MASYQIQLPFCIHIKNCYLSTNFSSYLKNKVYSFKILFYWFSNLYLKLLQFDLNLNWLKIERWQKYLIIFLFFVFMNFQSFCFIFFELYLSKPAIGLQYKLSNLSSLDVLKLEGICC